MNPDTDYVHTHVVNYEPTYLALMAAVSAWQDDPAGPLAPYRDELRATVESSFAAMGLDADDLTDDVDYADMIEWEAANA